MMKNSKGMARCRNVRWCVWNFAQKHWKTCVLLAFMFACYMYYRISVNGVRWYRWPYKFNDQFHAMPCPRPKNELKALVDLSHAAHRVFTSLNIVYSLGYGSLFGALRYGGPVPWDTDVDLFVRKETIDKYSLSELRQAFAAEGVHVDYLRYGGFYSLTKNNASCDCFLVTDFYGTGWMNRVGWESYVFFINYRWHHAFPARLLKAPLPKLEFGGLEMNVPREGWTIQKYHFRDDWRVEVKPPSCPKNMTSKWLYPPPP